MPVKTYLSGLVQQMALHVLWQRRRVGIERDLETSPGARQIGGRVVLDEIGGPGCRGDAPQFGDRLQDGVYDFRAVQANLSRSRLR